MSRSTSFLNAVRQIPTADAIRAEHHISLLDQELPASSEPVERNDEGDDDAERTNSEATASQPSTPGPNALVKRLTSNSVQVRQSVRRRMNERKYAKYNADRYDACDANDVPPVPPHQSPASQPQAGEPATALQNSYLERGRAKAKAVWKQRKKGWGRGKDNGDAIVEVLYENQRGWFFFGVPRYSASSLLPSDPKPWQNAQFRTSPVDIRTAQVPDPSWEWSWKSWYVDMSRDVDEEGWEYSLQFTGGFSWHGNHPWFHSFVRRRRWLRMRKRRDTSHHHTKEKAHELTADYFTIHSKTLRPPTEDPTATLPSQWSRSGSELDDEKWDVDKMEIRDIATLMRVLSKAPVDREKTVAVRRFVDEGGEELYYLASRMPEIMSLFIYQNSRRQLLSDLLRRHAHAHHRRESLMHHNHDDEDARREHETASRHATNLMNAVRAADEQVKRLEYWSDIKAVAQDEKTQLDPEVGQWNSEKWIGITSPVDAGETPFANKQRAEEGVRELHAHAEHPENVSRVGKGKEGDESSTPSKKSSLWFDAKQNPRDTSDDTDFERYTTAAESASEAGNKRNRNTTGAKGKNPIGSRLDGLDEKHEENNDGSEDMFASNDSQEPPSSTSLGLPNIIRPIRTKSVQLVEPVAEEEEAEDDQGRHGS